MKLISSIALIIILSLEFGNGQVSSPRGAFQNCPFHCLTIKINTDHTFVYRLNGDLYNDQRVGGTWRLVGRNRVHAVSSKVRTAPAVEERSSNRKDSFLVIVRDFVGSLVAGAEISGTAEGSRFSVKTNGEGQATIPRSREFEVNFTGYTGLHAISDSEANEFTVTLTVDQISGIVVNEEWLIEGNRLFIAESDGSVNRDFPLVRLSREAERRIFR